VPQNATTTKAQLLMPNMIRIASSMTESSSPALGSLRRDLQIVTKQLRLATATKPFSGGDETKLKQTLRNSPPHKKGMITMQFLLDLFWDQSRSRYLAAIGGHEAER
jgi:hypothetical protein